ncbi:ATP-binding protein [Streptomyces sp. NPDC098789]|uniref:ATP-binding protein n=1 Tax=Streptomyces sp. NPDC098789 TaxID=3366098 RepID=UPI00382A56BF
MSFSRQQTFPGTRDSVRAARNFIGDSLGGWGVADRRDDMRLCVSELAANVVTHGVPEGRRFAVRVEWVRDLVRIEVRDSGPGVPVVRCASPDALSGRGLWLVSQLADGLTVEDGSVGKTVSAVFRVRGEGLPASIDY